MRMRGHVRVGVELSTGCRSPASSRRPASTRSRAGRAMRSPPGQAQGGTRRCDASRDGTVNRTMTGAAVSLTSVIDDVRSAAGRDRQRDRDRRGDRRPTIASTGESGRRRAVECDRRVVVRRPRDRARRARRPASRAGRTVVATTAQDDRRSERAPAGPGAGATIAQAAERDRRRGALPGAAVAEQPQARRSGPGRSAARACWSEWRTTLDVLGGRCRSPPRPARRRPTRDESGDGRGWRRAPRPASGRAARPPPRPVRASASSPAPMIGAEQSIHRSLDRSACREPPGRSARAGASEGIDRLPDQATSASRIIERREDRERRAAGSQSGGRRKTPSADGERQARRVQLAYSSSGAAGA